MAQLSNKTRKLGLLTEQVQDFTPTPMTVSTETWYSGYHPYTLQPVFSAKSPEQKQRQRQYFFTAANTATTKQSQTRKHPSKRIQTRQSKRK